MGSPEHNLAVLGQIVKHIPKKLIEKLRGKYKIQTRAFSATSHVVAMIFAQLSHALSLNDICDGLRFHKGYLVQIRDCVPPSRNGLAHANATRDAGLAEELFWKVLADIKEKYPQFIFGSRHYPGLPWRFKRAIHVVDSTTIQLIAKCMNWAKHREQKAAAKMHLDLDLKSFLPNFAIVNRAKDSDPKTAWALCEPIRAGEIVVFDKAYVDFAHLHHLHQRGVIWVTRIFADNWAYQPLFDLTVDFLVELADSTRGDFRSLQRFRDVLHTPDRNIGQAHFAQILLIETLLGLISPDNLRPKGQLRR